MSPTSPVSATQSHAYTGLVEELPIIKAATTSRVVINNDILRFVLFSFDAGQLLTEHATPKAVVVQLLSGAMEFKIGNESSELHAGDMVYLSPGEKHALRAIEPCHMSLTMVDLTTTPATEEE